MDISKLKVADLRKELQSRGLDTKGNKPVLIERLREAIEKEKAEEEESENEEEPSSSSEGENSLTYETAESANNTMREAESTPSEERAFSVITSTASVHNNSTDDVDSRPISEPDEKQDIASEPASETSSPIQNDAIPEAGENELGTAEAEPSSDENEENHSEQVHVPEGEDSPSPDEPISYTKQAETIEDKQLEEEYSPQPKQHEQVEKDERMDFDEPSQEATEEPQPLANGDSVTQSVHQEAEETSPIQDEVDDAKLSIEQSQPVTNEQSSKSEENDELVEPPKQLDESITGGDTPVYDENEKTLPYYDETEKMDTETIPPVQSEADSEPKNDKGEEASQGAGAEAETLWNSDDESNDPQPTPVAEPPSEGQPEEPKKRVRKSRFDQPEERKRKHSPSPTGDGFQSSGYYEAPAKIPKQDDEPSYDQDSVLLSWYDSDLNLVISKENFVSAVPLCEQGFMYMWGGARSTYGFNSGKVYYDVKLTEKCSVNVYDDFEIYSFRLGWSVAYSSLQLGETSLSYGYDSSGKKCTDDTFEEYGQSFSAEDVVGCLLDFDSNEENVLITFAVNGVKQEVAFEVPKSSLEEKALFPHILSKNIKFEVNFGDRIESWNADESFKENFEWAAKVPLEQRVQGPKKPEEKTECEVIMMCGLPCSGKTTWVKNHVESHPEKMYNVIGIDFVLNKMKVITEPIQNHYKDAPDILVEKCTRCVNRLIDLASVRWRNYILDQPNVFATVQRRKMRNFEGYTRIAIVIIPSEEEYERMLEKWNDNTLRDTSITLLELKDQFKLPEEGDLFNNVSFVGVNKEEAEEIVKKYNKEGRDARARDERPYNRGFGGGRDHADRMQPYGRPPMGGYRQRWMDRGPPPAMGRGGWGPRGGMDRMPPGFRDRRNWRDRSPEDDRDGGYRGGRYQQRGMGGNRYGGGGGGPMMGDNRSWSRGRDRDRMPPRIGGPPGGPNPLMGQMMGKPMMGYSSDRKGRYGSDDGKRRDDGDSDEYERSRVNPPGVDEDVEETFDDGSGGEDGERKRRSRFSDSDRKDQGGYRGGRGGFQGRGGNGGRGGRGGNGRPGQFPPGKGPRGGGYSGRGRGPEGNSDYYGGRGGGPPRRDNRDNRSQMGPRQGSSRFDKRDSGGKNDGNSQVSQPPPGWGMYGQGGWNQQAANYQNWAQYQQAGYSAQQMQQYWSQMQQQNQQGQQNQQSQQQPGQQSSKNANSGNSTNAPSTSTTTSQSASNSSSQQSTGTSSGYNTQGYNTAGYGAQGYDANAYAQYCAQYYSQLAQQGWTTQNAWAAYGYNYGAMAASAGGVGGLPSTSVPPPSVTGGASGSSTGGSGSQSSAVTSASNK